MARPIERRRVVITGVGLISPLGVGTEANWQGLLAGESGIGPITRFDASAFTSQIAGQVPDSFDPLDFFEKKEIKKADSFIQYAVAAAQYATDDSGFSVEGDSSHRAGVILGSGIGGLPLVESSYETYLDRGPSRVSPFFIPAFIPNMAAGQVSIRFGLRGPSSSPCTACTTGLHAVGDAFRQIQFGFADAMYAGGAEGRISALGLAGFCSMRALSTRNEEPQKASRPWDRDRDGFVCGEGCGVLLLEELEQAQSRGAQIYAEIVGYGMSSDAYHISAPHPEGDGAARVMEEALKDAELEPEKIRYINAHGTSTPLGDEAEVMAIKRVFGEHAYKLAVSSTKSSTGHMLGAAGGFEAGVLALALKHQTLPATLNLDNPGEGCDLDFVPHTPRPVDMEYALTNSFGFGGTNGALILRRWDD